MKIRNLFKSGAHIDVKRMRSSSSYDHDWHPLDKRRGERVRGDTGVFELHVSGKERVHGSKKGK